MSDGPLSQEEIDAMLAGVDIAAGYNDGSSKAEASGGTQILTPEEIEDLLNAINASEKKEAGNHPPDDRPNSFSREHIREISIIHDKFALLAKKNLSDQFRTNVNMCVASVDQIYMGEFNRCIPIPSALGVIDMEPLKGVSILEIDPAIISAILKNICNSDGDPNKNWYELTEIEKQIITVTFNCLIKNLREAWSEIIDLQPKLVKIEPDPKFIRNTPTSLWVALVTLETKMWETEGMMNLCIPHPVIEPVLEKLIN